MAFTNLIYNRTVTVRRAATNIPADQLSNYNAPDARNRVAIATGVPAQISAARNGPPPNSRLPGDTPAAPFFDVVLPGGLYPPGTFLNADFVTDDTLVDYIVVVPDWSPIGYTLTSQMMTG